MKRNKKQKEDTVRQIGSSCLIAYKEHLYSYFNFTEITLETVENSLLHSYLSTINRLLIALHFHDQEYRGHLVSHRVKAFIQ